jgi:phosphoglycolate phosphatase-like HAD superfamily hydrolase
MNRPHLPDWLRPRPKARAVICDIDDTLCTQFDRPILAACKLLAALDRSIEVHYVTARPEASRRGTEQFLADQRLPGWRNLHFCPAWKSSRAHKAEVMARLARHYQVIVSIGDHDEDEEASRLAGVPFVRVRCDNVEEAWLEVARLIAALPPGDDPGGTA